MARQPLFPEFIQTFEKHFSMPGNIFGLPADTDKIEMKIELIEKLSSLKSLRVKNKLRSHLPAFTNEV